MEFDYIIVGAGSAGCVLAERLSAKGQRVLVLEAGGSDARFWIKLPLGYGYTFNDPKVNWRYTAEPDAGLNNRAAYWPRGRVIGGSSSINAMAYVRGLPHDFNDWEQAGAKGWNWGTVRQTYEKMESNSEKGADGKMRIRGNGPVRVSDLRKNMHPFSERFLDVARDLGWDVLDNMNGTSFEGISYYRSTVRNGIRHSAADAFLRPAMKRSGVKVVRGALVEKVEIENNKATGVWYRLGGKRLFARAKGEVILSAGAVNSPQVLQLSGVGPAALLKQHGIAVKADLSQVGQGLQDHLAITHHYAANEPTLNNRLGKLYGRMTAALEYASRRSGPLGVPVNQVGGFVRSDASRHAPDMQIYCNPASYGMTADGKPDMGPAPGFILSAQPCRPTSRGQINIVSGDPMDAPKIEPNSLSTEKDIDDVLRASRLVQAMAATPTVKRVMKAVKAPDISQMNDAELIENFRARASTVFHPTCTCRMGESATDSVLDARLRVHGIDGLRVVDASAFPNLTSGNTNAPTLMLAMRAADLILADAAKG